MTPDYEQKLEAAIRRELNTLGELPAPAGLEARVLHAIEQRASAPWYRRAWPSWPAPLQVASAIGLLVAFAGLCFGAWHFTQTPVFAVAAEKVSGALECLGFVQRILNLLVNSLGRAFAGLGPVVLAAVACMLAGAYAVCVGLGTVYLRLAFVRRQI